MEPIAQPTCWSEIKHKIKALNPLFYENIDAMSPSDDLRMLIVKYPYGFKMSDEKAFYMPRGYEDYMEGDGFDRKAPLTFVLDKQIEYYFDTPHNHVPWLIYYPGDFFPSNIVVNFAGDLRFRPKSIFTVTSGIRDVTLLSLHGTTNDFYALRRKYQIPAEMSPSNPLNHFDIFQRIVQQEKIEWYSTVVLFGKEWRHEIDNNMQWWPLRQYLLHNSMRKNRAYQNIIFLDQAIYDITRSLDFKFRPFVHETIKQILLIVTGEVVGFRPAADDSGLPLDEVSEALKNSSRELLSYPTIMQAAMMKQGNRDQLIYNSITYNTLTKYDQKINPNTYLNEIMIHLKDYLIHFKDHFLTKDTAFAELHDALEIIPCSTRGSAVYGIKKCIEMYDIDKSFWYPRDVLGYKARYGAPINSQFCKGFIGLRWNKEPEVN